MLRSHYYSWPILSGPPSPIQYLYSSLTSSLPYLSQLLIGMLWFAALGCSSPQVSEATRQTSSPSSSEQVNIQYAEGFDINYSQPHPILSITGSNDTARYVLLPTGASLPEGLAPSTQVIRTPVQRIVATSTTHLGLIEWLDARDRLVGIGRADLVYDDTIRYRVREGRIQEVGTDGALNVELVLSLQPDVVMVSATPGVRLAQYQPLLSAGIPVIVNAEWMEASPLGKAEWVKLMAVLLQQEEYVNQRFGTMASRYDSIAQRAQQTTQQPLVITGSPFQGSWYVPGRDSYVGQLLRDAQATWPWSQDTSAVSFNVSLETVYPYGLEADYWINPGLTDRLSSLGEQDERLMAFQPYQQKEVYNYYRRTSPDGGNDYYEGGTVHPDLILADLVEIFHPEVLDHSLYYYQKLQ